MDRQALQERMAKLIEPMCQVLENEMCLKKTGQVTGSGDIVYMPVNMDNIYKGANSLAIIASISGVAYQEPNMEESV